MTDHADPPRGAPRVDVLLTHEPLELDRAVAAVSAPTCGGIGTFSGVVRDHHEGASVTHLVYEAWDERAEVELHAVAASVLADHPGVRAVHLAHRLGRLEIGEVSVITAASAPHRGEAIAATEALIDRLKATVPIWKHEFLTDGSSRWAGCDTAT